MNPPSPASVSHISRHPNRRVADSPDICLPRHPSGPLVTDASLAADPEMLPGTSRRRRPPPKLSAASRDREREREREHLVVFKHQAVVAYLCPCDVCACIVSEERFGSRPHIYSSAQIPVDLFFSNRGVPTQNCESCK